MKILHTSDWHIGKRLMGKENEDRLEEQREALDSLTTLCEEENIELILVAGDVFDTYLPSAEAEEVFYEYVQKLAGENRLVVAVSGNHDDGVRLTAASPLAEKHGVYLIGNKSFSFTVGGERKTHLKACGNSCLVVENEKGECVYINCLPYPNEARFREEKTEESYFERVARWINRGDEGYKGDMPHILLSHIFVAGGKTSESERDIDLGGARAVPVHTLPEEGYIALGHLHRRQKIGNAYYCGSLLAYSFDEVGAKRGVNIITTNEKEITSIEERDLELGKPLVRLQSASVEDALNLLAKYEGHWVELTLYLSAPLTNAETHALMNANAGLCELKTIVEGAVSDEVVRRSTMTDKELFVEYYKSVFNAEPEEELLTTFLSLMEEV